MNKNLYNLLIIFCLLFSKLLVAQSYKLELIKDINPSGNGIDRNYINERQSLVFNGLYYFTAVTPAERAELWVTDGTESGTKMVKDIDSIGSSNPRYLTSYKGKLYFSAKKSGIGTELWRSDGTEQGTTLVVDQSPGGASATPTNIVVFKDKLWYTGIQVNSTPSELSYSDGTEVGTKTFRGVDSTESFLTNVSISSVTDSMLYLTGNIKAAGAGVEFVRTDGTVIGTTIVKDLLEGIDSFDLVNFTVHNDGKKMLFFAATKTKNPPKDYGVELWKSDGTTLGTNLVKDFNPNGDGSTRSEGGYMFNYKGKTYFNVFNETVGDPFYNTWRTDGTAQGTEIFERDSGLISLGFAEFNADLYYLNGAKKHEIWKTDGINKRFVYKTGFFDEGNAVVKSFLYKDRLLYFYSDLSNTKNYSDLIEISKDTARSLVNDFPGFENIYDIEKFGNSFILKLKTTDKGIELYRLTFTTSTSELQAVQSLTLFPNPSSGDITIDSPEHGVLKIFNLMGQQVFQQQISQIGKILVSPNLPSGSYEVVLNGASKQYQSKLIITK